jgi:hypothetical protein
VLSDKFAWNIHAHKIFQILAIKTKRKKYKIKR